MSFDNWKTAAPEDEQDRYDRLAEQREARERYLEDNYDRLIEQREERRAEW